jgi:hypothetical protein
MGLGDMANKAKDALKQHPDQADQGVDKAAEFADERTGGQHSDQINKGRDKLKQQFGGNDDQQR